MRIIILTKNISYEIDLQRELQILSHEVFVGRSTEEEEWLIESAKLFDCLFVSETIADPEFLLINQTLAPHYQQRIVRILAGDREQEGMIAKAENATYLNRSFVELREFLAALPPNSRKLEKASVTKESFPKFLSLQEQIFFNNLGEEQFINREDLCWKIWGNGGTNSRKSQLSILAKRINEKLDEYDYTEKRVRTAWGKGYILQ